MAQVNLEIGSVLVLLALPFAALFLGRRRITACIRAYRWLEAVGVWLAYCLLIAGPFVIAVKISSDPTKAPLTVIQLLVVAVCVDGVVRRLRTKQPR